jgi:hypothetical protein
VNDRMDINVGKSVRVLRIGDYRGKYDGMERGLYGEQLC